MRRNLVQAQWQLTRPPRSLPSLIIAGYDLHPAIRAPVVV